MLCLYVCVVVMLLASGMSGGVAAAQPKTISRTHVATSVQHVLLDLGRLFDDTMVVDRSVAASVTAALHNASLDASFTAVLRVRNYHLEHAGNLIYVYRRSAVAPE